MITLRVFFINNKGGGGRKVCRKVTVTIYEPAASPERLRSVMVTVTVTCALLLARDGLS